MNVHPAVIAAGIMATVLLSGHGQMNLIHHEVIPQIIAEQQIVTVRPQQGIKGFLGGEQIDIRMGNEIKDQDSVIAIIKALQEASSLDTITFHINGYGGQVDTTFELIDNVRMSKAHVIMSVESPSFSGHAYLAVSGDELIVAPFASLMFHTSSAYGTSCSEARLPGTEGEGDPGYDPNGTDRTVSNQEHCERQMASHFLMITKFFTQEKYLTGAEKEQIMTGHDIYLSADDLHSRGAK